MSNNVKHISFSPGYITITDESGSGTRYAVANILRALDIPTGLTYTQVQAVTALSNILAVLIRTLVARDILDESFLEDGEYTLESLTEAIEQMGGDYGDPDISVD
jgi:hypothetical protein